MLSSEKNLPLKSKTKKNVTVKSKESFCWAGEFPLCKNNYLVNKWAGQNLLAFWQPSYTFTAYTVCGSMFRKCLLVFTKSLV